ncbi:MAG: glycoside hydrolase family 1 protein [Deltaproteobacteria bacterium]|nr:glycoside hydrolase family 1 protein [Deltaproteobacteria bacterium]
MRHKRWLLIFTLTLLNLLQYSCKGLGTLFQRQEQENDSPLIDGNPHGIEAIFDSKTFYERLGLTEQEVQDEAISNASSPINLNLSLDTTPGSGAAGITGTQWDINGHFMNGFLWGTAISAHQVEGYNTNNDWWQFETYCKGGIIFKAKITCWPQFVRDSGRAVDHFSLFTDADLDKAKALGTNAIRISIEWSRIETAKDTFSASATTYYRNYLQKIRDRGMKPVVTLWHFTLPIWVQRPGYSIDLRGRHDQMDNSLKGWQNKAVVWEFAAFAKYCAQNFGDLVDIWVTHNEPVGTIMVGYMAGFFPPGYLLQWKRAKAAILNIARAHNKAYDAIKSFDRWDSDATLPVPQPDGENAKVGLVQAFRHLIPNNSRGAADLDSAKKLDYFYHYQTIDAAYAGRLDTNWDGNSDETLENGARKLDFIGVNYYSTFMVSPKYAGNLPWFLTKAYPEIGSTLWIADNNATNVPHNSLGWQVYPDGLYEVLMKVKNRYGNIPVYITENGIADSDGSTNKRAQYIISHLQMMLKAYRDGADIRGYFYWTLMDNFEWREGLRKEAHFGLYHVDTGDHDVSLPSDSLARTPTAAVNAYKAIITENGISSTILTNYGSYPDMPTP